MTSLRNGQEGEIFHVSTGFHCFPMNVVNQGDKG